MQFKEFTIQRIYNSNSIISDKPNKSVVMRRYAAVLSISIAATAVPNNPPFGLTDSSASLEAWKGCKIKAQTESCNYVSPVTCGT
ncbi:hypothetical protein ACOSQ3_021695 [Xanthoceras sorbifolium]